MAILSFQGPRGGHTFPLQGVSTIWYWKLLNPGKLTEYSDVGEFMGNYLGAFKNTIILAILVTIISTVLAFAAAQGYRKMKRGHNIIFYLWILGIITPGLIVGLGSSLLYKQLGIPLHWSTTTLFAHVTWTLPFCFVIFLMMFNRFDPSLEEASQILGADKRQTFWNITYPLMKPAILSSCLFAFTLSLDEYQRSVLLTGVDQTLPVMVMASVTTRITPTLYALGTLTSLLSFSVIIAYLIYLGRLLKANKIKERIQEKI